MYISNLHDGSYIFEVPVYGHLNTRVRGFESLGTGDLSTQNTPLRTNARDQLAGPANGCSGTLLLAKS